MKVQSVFLYLLLTVFSTSLLAQSKRVDFTIAFQGLETDLRIITSAVAPGEALRIRTLAQARASHGKLRRDGGHWVWQAPVEPGRYQLLFAHNQQVQTLNLFVLTPFSNGEQDELNGYRIGRYASELFRGLSSYSAPTGFIDLAHGPADLQISPSFTLEQFICKQQPGHDPTYLLIRPALLIKLETLLEAANARGWQASTFHVMSGFRTPHYNRSIGNITRTSRHLYGGAADIWIDNDGDGDMDDLNGDGRIDRNDARALARLAEQLARQGGRNWPSGGLGTYGSTPYHGPNVHIDARGYRARW